MYLDRVVIAASSMCLSLSVLCPFRYLSVKSSLMPLKFLRRLLTSDLLSEAIDDDNASNELDDDITNSLCKTDYTFKAIYFGVFQKPINFNFQTPQSFSVLVQIFLTIRR